MTKRHQKKSHKKRATYKRKTIRGGCGCNGGSQTTTPQSVTVGGGAKLQKGGYGPASWQAFPSTDIDTNVAYKVNDYMHDPNNPSVDQASRLAPSWSAGMIPFGKISMFGGKRGKKNNKNKKNKKSSKKSLKKSNMMRGGGAVTPSFTNNTYSDMQSGVNTIFGIPGISPAVYSQHVDNVYTNPHNPMLV